MSADVARAGNAERRPRWPIRLEVGLLVALGAVLAMRAEGIARAHLRPVALYLAAGVLLLPAFLASLQMERRYARRLATTGIPANVRFTKPLWMETSNVTLVLAFGAISSAAFAALGLPGIGAGALLAFVLIAVAFPFFIITMWPRGLTFEPNGLRVHVWRATFFVPWASVESVEEIGPDHMQAVVLEVTSPSEIVAKAEPNLPRTRARLESFVATAKGPLGKVTLWPGTAGLDGPTIARAVRAALRGGGGQVN